MAKASKTKAARKAAARATKPKPATGTKAKPPIAPSKKAVQDWLAADPKRSGKGLSRAAGLGENTVNMGLSPDRIARDFDNQILARLAPVMNMTIGQLLGEAPSATPMPAPGQPVSSQAAAPGHLVMLRHDQVRPDPDQPRKWFDPDALQSMADTIAAQGILTPATVRPDPKKPGHYIIIFGERRWRGLGLAIKANTSPTGLLTYPAIIRNVTAAEALRMQMLENLERADMHPLEEGEGFLAMRDRDGVTTAQIAQDFGKSQKWVQRRIQLAERLSPNAKKQLLRGEMSVTAARELVQAPFASQDAVLKFIAFDTGELEARELLRASAMPLEAALFDQAKYKGEYLLDEDGVTRTHYADGAQARGLQKSAVRQRVAQLEKQYAKVAEQPWHFHPEIAGYLPEDPPAKGAKGAFAFWSLDAETGAYREWLNWAKPPSIAEVLGDAPGKVGAAIKPALTGGAVAGAAGFGETMSRPAPHVSLRQLLDGQRVRTEALQSALSDCSLPAGEIICMALVCYGFFDATQSRTLRLRPEHGVQRSWREDEKVRAILKPAIEAGLLDDDHLTVTPTFEGDFFLWLCNASDEETPPPQISDRLSNLFQVLVASTVGDFAPAPQLGATALARAIATAAEAEPSDHRDLKTYTEGMSYDDLRRVARMAVHNFDARRDLPVTVPDFRAWLLTNARPGWVPPEQDFLSAERVQAAYAEAPTAEAAQ